MKLRRNRRVYETLRDLLRWGLPARYARKAFSLANRLLLGNNARFGSIDHESNYLIRPVSNAAGTVELLADDEKVRRGGDSHQFAGGEQIWH